MNITVQTGELYPWQEQVFASYVYDEKKIYVLNNSRQTGKTYLLTQLILYSAINEQYAHVGVTSLTYKQSKIIYEYISTFLKGTPLLENDNKSSLEIRLVNGSKITFLSIQNADAIRGFTFSHLFCDEAAYYQDSIFTKVLQPTVIAKGQKVVLASTPRGTNWFFDYFNMGRLKDTNVKSFMYDWTANPNLKEEEIQQIKKSIPDAVFKQEYLCQFTDSGSVFANLRNVCINDKYPKASGSVYVGIDIGLFNDYTVCVAIDQTGQVVDFFRDRNGSINKTNEAILKFVKKNAPIKTLIELNNVGISSYEYLYPRHKNIEGFKTTAVSKPDLINQLQTSIDEQRIMLPDHTINPDLYNELADFSFTYSEKTRAIIYAALPGRHDDCVIALALANKAYVDANHKLRLKPKVFFG